MACSRFSQYMVYCGHKTSRSGGSMKLSLIVVYTKQLLEMKAFYESLGLSFKLEKHEDGPEHYYAKVADRIGLELYPANEGSIRPPHKLEFTSGNIPDIVHNLIKNGWREHLGWRDSKRGSLYLVDPDGNELTLQPPQFPIKFLSIE